MMQSAGGSSTSAEETLITWSGTNGEDYPTSMSDFTTADWNSNTSYTMTGNSGGLYSGIGDGGNQVLVGGQMQEQGALMLYSDDNGDSWSDFLLPTWKNSDTVPRWYSAQTINHFDDKFWAVGRGWVGYCEDNVAVDNPNNWTMHSPENTSAVGGYSQSWKVILPMNINGTESIVISGNDAKNGNATLANPDSWTTRDVGSNSLDHTAGLIVPTPGSNTNETFLLLNSGERYTTDMSTFTAIAVDQVVTNGSQRSWTDGHWGTTSNSTAMYLPASPTVSDYTSGWTTVDLGTAFGNTTVQLRAWGRGADGTAMTGGTGFFAFAKNPKNVGGSDGWKFVDNSSMSGTYVNHGFYNNGRCFFMVGQTINSDNIYMTDGWTGDEVTVTFDSQLASSPIKYRNTALSSSATENDASLYNALTAAISAGDLTNCTVSYNNGTNNGTGVKVINTIEEDVANITISGASSSSTINTYEDN